MAGGRGLPAGSGCLFAADRRRFRRHRRRLLALDGCHTRPCSPLGRSRAISGSRPNRNGLPRSSVALGSPTWVALRTRVTTRPGLHHWIRPPVALPIRVLAGPPARVTTGPGTGGTRRTRIRGLPLGPARRPLGSWAAAAPPLVPRVDRGLSVRPGRWRLHASGMLRPGAPLGRGCRRLGGGSLAPGREGTRDEAGVIAAGRLRRRLGSAVTGTRRRRGRLRDRRERVRVRTRWRGLALGSRGVPVPSGSALSIGARRREPGPMLSGVRRRRGCRGGLGGPVRRELAGRRDRGAGVLRAGFLRAGFLRAGFLRTGVRCAGLRRCVRSGWFGRFWPVWFETPWPGGGVGRLVHASSLVRPPDGRWAQPIEAETLPRQAVPDLRRRHTAGRR
jgi:hypothetical protein